jgi:hypothetical protein
MRPTGKIQVNGHWVRDEFSPHPGGIYFNKKMYLCEKCEEVISGIANARGLRKSIEKLSRRFDGLERKLQRARD